MIYLELLWTFFKIGAFTFGGGYAMLPLMQEQVLAHGWSTEEEIINFIINECEMTVLNLDYSPIKGPQGNIEYLVHILKNNTGENRAQFSSEDIVSMSHNELDKKE